jgi:hypothetical protein
MTAQRRTLLVCSAVVFTVLALPGAAFGQATRTWVSGVGDDANPCSRTAPCKTFAGAISKTAAGGEMNIIDPGGFGGVTITKSITIRGRGGTAGALVSGTNAIVVNAAATDKVVIDGLDINGIGIGAQSSLTGIKILSARHVIIRRNEIYRFKAGIASVPTSAQTRVVVTDNLIHDNGVGVFNAPGNNLISFTAMALSDNVIADNTCGVAVGAFGANASTPDANTDCGTAAAGAINKTAVSSVFDNKIHDNGIGVLSRGAAATAEIAGNRISGNFTFGLRRLDLGAIRTFSPANNVITNNAASDAPSATTNQTRR